jgi:hypothetical protein
VSAARGWGDGSFSSGNGGGCFFRGGGVVFGFDFDLEDRCDGGDDSFNSASSSAAPSCIAAVVWYRAWILGLYGIFFAAAYGHDGRRGTGFASNCEAHLDRAIRFIKEEKKKGPGTKCDKAGQEQQQLDSVVCVPGPKSRLPELFCQAFIPLSD